MSEHIKVDLKWNFNVQIYVDIKSEYSNWGGLKLSWTKDFLLWVKKQNYVQDKKLNSKHNIHT